MSYEIEYLETSPHAEIYSAIKDEHPHLTWRLDTAGRLQARWGYPDGNVHRSAYINLCPPVDEGVWWECCIHISSVVVRGQCLNAADALKIALAELRCIREAATTCPGLWGWM